MERCPQLLRTGRDGEGLFACAELPGKEIVLNPAFRGVVLQVHAQEFDGLRDLYVGDDRRVLLVWPENAEPPVCAIVVGTLAIQCAGWNPFALF